MKSISQKRGKTIHTMFTWEKQNPTLVKTNTNCPHMFQRAWCPVTHILLMIIQQKNLNGLDLQRRPFFLSFFHTHLSTRMNYFKYPSIYVRLTRTKGLRSMKFGQLVNFQFWKFQICNSFLFWQFWHFSANAI